MWKWTWQSVKRNPLRQDGPAAQVIGQVEELSCAPFDQGVLLPPTTALLPLQENKKPDGHQTCSI